jgi:hypothetical protein
LALVCTLLGNFGHDRLRLHYVSTTLELPTSSEVRLLEDSSQFGQNYLQRHNLLLTPLEKAGGSQAYVIWGVTPADTGNQIKVEMDVGK